MKCTKHRFSKHAANRALRSCRKQRRAEARSYFCDECHAYHLTRSPAFWAHKDIEK